MHVSALPEAWIEQSDLRSATRPIEAYHAGLHFFKWYGAHPTRQLPDVRCLILESAPREPRWQVLD